MFFLQLHAFIITSLVICCNSLAVSSLLLKFCAFTESANTVHFNVMSTFTRLYLFQRSFQRYVNVYPFILIHYLFMLYCDFAVTLQ